MTKFNWKDQKKTLKAIRKKRKWSVRDLADQLGVSPRTVEGWEQERFTIPGPARKLLESIA